MRFFRFCLFCNRHVAIETVRLCYSRYIKARDIMGFRRLWNEENPEWVCELYITEIYSITSTYAKLLLKRNTGIKMVSDGYLSGFLQAV